MRVPLVPLQQVAEVKLGRQRSPKNHSGELMRPYVRAANIGWSGWKLDDVKSMNFTDSEMATYGLKLGDLLLSEASGSANEVGKPALWEGQISDCAFQNTLIRVRPDGPDSRYLLQYFSYCAASGRFARLSRGVGIFHLGKKALAEMEIPLPPIEEQRRIAAVLDAADALRTKRRRALAMLDTLPQAIFHDMFGDPLAPDAGLATTDLGAVTTFVRGVTFKPSDVLTASTDGTVAVMRTANVQSDLDLSDVWYVSDRFVKRDEQYLQPFDTLISSANSWNLVGRCCLVPASMERSTFGGFVTALRPSGSEVLPRYLHAWFSSPKLQQTVRSFGRKTTNISNLDLKRCASLPIALPPLREQQEFERRIDEVADFARENRGTLTKLDELFASLQQRAFRGEL